LSGEPGLLQVGLALLGQGAEMCAAVAPTGLGRLRWRELRNKLEAFELYQRGVPIGAGGDLGAAVARARRLGPFRGVWALEGLGNQYAAAEWRRRPAAAPRRLLAAGSTPGLPEDSLLALHTGMGLALAERVLGGLPPRPGSAELRRALARFLALCRDHSRPGYAGAAFEGLGLVARTLHPGLVAEIDAQLARPDGPAGDDAAGRADLVSYFWHGAGRALYFLPSNAPPLCSAPWRAVGMARAEPPHERGRASALAGLVWALTLVNLRHPEVLAELLVHHPLSGAESAAVADGIGSAVVLWQDLAPGDPCLAAFLRYRPRPAGGRAAALWQRLVAGPCAAAAAGEAARRMRQAGRLEELFRFSQGGAA
jgi:hypothetical protein